MLHSWAPLQPQGERPGSGPGPLEVVNLLGDLSKASLGPQSALSCGLSPAPVVL